MPLTRRPIKGKNALLSVYSTIDYIILYVRCPRENVRIIIAGASFEDVEILLGFGFGQSRLKT